MCDSAATSFRLCRGPCVEVARRWEQLSIAALVRLIMPEQMRNGSFLCSLHNRASTPDGAMSLEHLSSKLPGLEHGSQKAQAVHLPMELFRWLVFRA